MNCWKNKKIKNKDLVYYKRKKNKYVLRAINLVNKISLAFCYHECLARKFRIYSCNVQWKPIFGLFEFN